MKTTIFIGNYTKGVQTNRRPFMIAEEAWETLNNAFIFRGRVRKKLGYTLKGRLKRCIDCPITLAATTTGDPYTIADLFADTNLALDTLNPNGELVPGTTILVVDEQTFTDQGDGTFSVSWIITGATQANPCEITSVGSNIVTGTMVTITGVTGMTELNGNTYTVTSTGDFTFTLDSTDATGYGTYTGGGTFTSDQSNQVFQVSQLPTVDTFTLRRAPGDEDVIAITGTYIGGGTVQSLDYFEIKTKFFIPYWKQDQQINVNHVDFLLDNSSIGEYSLEVFANEDDNINLMDPAYPSLYGDPAERAVIRGGPEEDDDYAATQKSIWHRKYLQAAMATIQVGINLNDDQMGDPEIAQADFELHGMILNVEPVSEII